MKNKLTMDYPAAWWSARWREAIPVGNGSIGASVYGSVNEETILLTHEDLWANSIKQDLPDVSDKLPLVRELLFSEKIVEAEYILVDALKEKGLKSSTAWPLPLGDFKIIMPVKKAFQDYSRVLNMETGEAEVCWTDCENRFSRKLFTSRTDDIIVYKIKSSKKGSISADLWLDLHDIDNATKPFGFNTAKLPEDIEIVLENGFIFYAAKNDDCTDFGAVAKVITEKGNIEYSGTKLKVTDADEIIVLIKVFIKATRVEKWKQLKSELLSVNKNYDELLKPHAEAHGKLFNSAVFKITDKEAEHQLSNEQLLMKAYKSEAPKALIEKMWSFGRYLLISSSREGGQPCPLLGLWAGDYDAFWAFNMANENLQMIYWQALTGNMPQLLIPVFDYYENMMDQFRTNAKNIYGCGGVFIPAVSTPGVGILQDLGPHIVQWTGAAGWIAQHYYDYYLFTGDKDFLLKRAIPFMTEVTDFYKDFFILDEDGFYISAPSNSPENTPSNYLTDEGKNKITLLGTAINATMDFAIAKEVLTNLIQGASTLGGFENEIDMWNEMLLHIPPYQINEDGAIKEWMHPFFKDNYKHRHQSHIYPVFPGVEVTREENPTLFEAFVTAINKRLSIGLTSQCNWSLAHMACNYARMEEGELALECLDNISRSMLMNNFFTSANDWRSMGIGLDMNVAPFQIDANMGWTAAINEMLVFSKPGLIRLLPALPESWLKGSVTGLLCRGGIKIDMVWDMENKKMEVTLEAKTDQQLILKFPRVVRSIESNLELTESSYGECYKTVLLKSNKKELMNIYFS